MIGRLILTGVMTMTMGCASVPPGGEDDIPVRGESGFRCDAAPAQAFVGQIATASLAADAQQRSGARTVRWLRPGQMVTMEFLADRLNIEVDAENRVIAIRCG